MISLKFVHEGKLIIKAENMPLKHGMITISIISETLISDNI